MTARKRQKIRSRLVPALLIGALALGGCSTSHTNLPVSKRNPGKEGRECAYESIGDAATLDPTLASPRSSYAIGNRAGSDDKVLFALAISGGGSRAAVFGAEVMLAFQNVKLSADSAVPSSVDLLSQVDAISAVSGGALPAAYYAISSDPSEPNKYLGRVWTPDEVRKGMQKNYLLRWFGNWFWPANIARYWTTAFDRSDIMAQTLADNLFDHKLSGRDAEMRDLRCDRPYLILNSTNGTAMQFGSRFAFVREDFEEQLRSSIEDYSVARAVMASASFPGVFPYMTLGKYPDSEREEPESFVHVFDGGNVDNLGLLGLRRAIEAVKRRGESFKAVVVVSIDAYTEPNGVDPSEPDTRTIVDQVVDTNFLDSSDALLARNRDSVISAFTGFLKNEVRGEGNLVPINGDVIFYHMTFRDVEKLVGGSEGARLFAAVNSIPTSFRIRGNKASAIKEVTERIVSEQNPCIRMIARVFTQGGGATSWPQDSEEATSRPGNGVNCVVN